MRAAKLTSAVGISALLLCALASASAAQDRQGAPGIRIYSTNGAYVVNTTSYVSPVIQLSEPAYVFAVSMDLDGQIQILQPDWPGLSVRILANKPLNLPNFFAGFQRSTPGGLYATSAYSGYDSYNGYNDVRGTVIALASRVPFNLDAIESDGDWNISSVRQMIQGRSPQSAAQSLAYYLGAKGEPIGHDILRFAGGQSYNSYAYSNYYSPCDMFAAYPASFASRLYQARLSVDRLQASGRRAAISYDLCGLPYVIVQPSTGVVRGVRPPPPPRGDSNQIPRARLPRKGDERPRLPRSAANSAPEGVFPIPRRGELPQMGDVTITAPRARRNEPRPILDGYRSQPGIQSVPEGRRPIDRLAGSGNAPAAATGTFQIRESRPEPRPEPRTSAPPPRAPDTPKQSSPAPVERERPTPPPAPRETPAVTNRPAPPSKQQ